MTEDNCRIEDPKVMTTTKGAPQTQDGICVCILNLKKSNGMFQLPNYLAFRIVDKWWISIIANQTKPDMLEIKFLHSLTHRTCYPMSSYLLKQMLWSKIGWVGMHIIHIIWINHHFSINLPLKSMAKDICNNLPFADIVYYVIWEHLVIFKDGHYFGTFIRDISLTTGGGGSTC